MDNTFIYQFKLGDNVSDIFITPPIVSIGEKIDAYKINVHDGLPDKSSLFSIDNISIENMKSINKNESQYELIAHVSSKSKQYPRKLTLVSNGTYYPGIGNIKFCYESNTEETILQSIEFSYLFSVC